MKWFPNRLSCRLWAGPTFRFPFTESTFLEDTRCRELPSYALLDVDERSVGFGQYYLRAGRCHLARLVIAPEHRGQGLGRSLIGGLVELGMQNLRISECSLFVAADNASAIQLYRKVGFEKAPYPEDDPSVAAFVYMVASAVKLRI